MKTVISSIIVIAFMASCNNSANQQAEIQRAKQQTLDSINQGQMAARIQQLTADSLKRVEELQRREIAASSQQQATSGENTPAKKKGMSNTTKGALIGTGAGIVTGAVTGALIDGKKGEGAIVGGLIGGAAGSGIGAAAGNSIDKKKKK